jgi:predicted proteasome-type protease
MHFVWSAYRFNLRWTRKALLLFRSKEWRYSADYFRDLRSSWSQGLRNVFNQLPEPDWLAY